MTLDIELAIRQGVETALSSGLGVISTVKENLELYDLKWDDSFEGLVLDIVNELEQEVQRCKQR